MHNIKASSTLEFTAEYLYTFSDREEAAKRCENIYLLQGFEGGQKGTEKTRAKSARN